MALDFFHEFFVRAFHFEESDYATTRSRLLQLAAFSPAQETDFICIKTLARPAERCIFVETASTSDVLDAGIFYEPKVCELRNEVASLLRQPDVAAAVKRFAVSRCDRVKGEHVISDAIAVHKMAARETGWIIQAASQYNYLEFFSDNGTPEDGISGYADDVTQGPRCAMACPAGAAYRNYLIRPDPLWKDQQRGQTERWQLNGFRDATKALEKLFFGGVDITVPWRCVNGYIIEASKESLEPLRLWMKKLRSLEDVDEIVGNVRVGVQQDTTIVLPEVQKGATCTQVFCSTVSAGYSSFGVDVWRPLCAVALNAAYEGTVYVAIKESIRRSLRDDSDTLAVPTLALTMIGGGAYENDHESIAAAIRRAFLIAEALEVPLNVKLVHFKRIDERYADVFHQTLS